MRLQKLVLLSRPASSEGGGFLGIFKKEAAQPQAPVTKGIDWSNVDISEASKQTLENIGNQGVGGNQ